MKTPYFFAIAALLTAPAIFGQGQAPVYPAKGQTPQQQQQDQAECATWAQQQTGVNPEALAAQTTPPTEQKGGPAMRHEEKKSASEQQQQAQAQKQQKLKAYDNAKNTCLKGRGYTVG